MTGLTIDFKRLQTDGKGDLLPVAMRLYDIARAMNASLDLAEKQAVNQTNQMNGKGTEFMNLMAMVGDLESAALVSASSMDEINQAIGSAKSKMGDIKWAGARLSLLLNPDYFSVLADRYVYRAASMNSEAKHIQWAKMQSPMIKQILDADVDAGRQPVLPVRLGEMSAASERQIDDVLAAWSYQPPLAASSERKAFVCDTLLDFGRAMGEGAATAIARMSSVEGLVKSCLDGFFAKTASSSLAAAIGAGIYEHAMATGMSDGDGLAAVVRVASFKQLGQQEELDRNRKLMDAAISSLTIATKNMGHPKPDLQMMSSGLLTTINAGDEKSARKAMAGIRDFYVERFMAEDAQQSVMGCVDILSSSVNRMIDLKNGAEPDLIRTDYLTRSHYMDADKNRPESTSKDIFARAFEAFVCDRMKSTNLLAENNLLVGDTRSMDYPAGNERAVILNKMADFVSDIQAEATSDYDSSLACA